MATSRQWEQAVEKLLVMTEGGALQWSKGYFVPSCRDEVLGDAIYGTQVNNRLLAVYEYRYKQYQDEDTWRWDNEVAIEFVDATGGVQWQWPATPHRWRLLDAIRCRVSGAAQFLAEFLPESPDDPLA